MSASGKVVKPVPKAAWIVAAVADVVQLVALPFFGEGFLSPVNTALDIIVSIVLVKLLGWHLVLLPALAAEMVPLVDLAPTWTLSVGVVALTRRKAASAAPPAASEPPQPAAPSGSHAEVVEGSTPALPGPPVPPSA